MYLKEFASPDLWKEPNSVANMRMMSALSLLTIFWVFVSHRTGTCVQQHNVVAHLKQFSPLALPYLCSHSA